MEYKDYIKQGLNGNAPLKLTPLYNFFKNKRTHKALSNV